jgi:hypothetical protein
MHPEADNEVAPKTSEEENPDDDNNDDVNQI